MVMKRDLVIAVLCTFCLTLTLFTILPAGSNYKTSGIGEYDPWIDTNDDGSINILDCIILGGAFGTTGTPINKTALLLELQAKIESLTEKINALEEHVYSYGYILVGGEAFNPFYDEYNAGDMYNFLRDASVLTLTRSSDPWVPFVAFVELPQGANVTDFTVWLYDNSNYPIEVELGRYCPSNETYNVMAYVTTYPPSSKPGKVTLSDHLIINPVIDNSVYTYSLLVTFGSEGFQGDIALRLNGVLIQYKINK